MRKGYVTSITAAALGLLLLGAPPADAGKLYQLEYEFKVAAPMLPADIVLNVYEGDKREEDKLKGTSSETFNGNGDIPIHMCDAVACLTDTRIVDDELCITFVGTGFDNGKFKSETFFEIIVNGVSTGINQHTSCSQELPLDAQPGDNGGTFQIIGGSGECIGEECGPRDDKLYELGGTFCEETDGCIPTTVTFNVYKGDNDLKGTATADIVGGELVNVVNDSVAELLDVEIGGMPEMVCFTWKAYGQKDDGTFENDVSFEFITDCGFPDKSEEIHTSCSRPIPIEEGFVVGGGIMTFLGELSCGYCLIHPPISVEDASWGTIKSQYR